ncbi:MAG: septum formation protein Maf [Gammaproteobacteria bacterium]|jgi:septum formation protein|nr:septum formation protein Maf [Gammaproteobacteria bacterium]MBT4492625.1 septum formation protein Maf [Gammaproteobacteria bacterium]MBT7370236.1 septum formation protein Maf [Gammaproteobacteria bacterium]
MNNTRLVLASTSPYRKRLLDQLGSDALQMNPNVDETSFPNETPAKLALRLGRAKAESVASRLEPGGNWLVVGSDQVCHFNGQIYSKPGDFATAALQLTQFSNHWISFSTSLVVIAGSGHDYAHVEDFEILFRSLSAETIDAYLADDQPFDCAGAIKVESLGITLLDDSRGRDINSLYGLPLMALIDAFKALGYTINNFR